MKYFRFILFTIAFTVPLKLVWAQIVPTDKPELIEVEQLLIQNQRERALEKITPLYFSKKGKTSFTHEDYNVAILYGRALELYDQNEEAVAVFRTVDSAQNASNYQKILTQLYFARLYEKVQNAELTAKHLYLAKGLLEGTSFSKLYTKFYIRAASYHRVLASSDSAKYYVKKALSLIEREDISNPQLKGETYFLTGFLNEEPDSELVYVKKAHNIFKAARDTNGWGFMAAALYRINQNIGNQNTAKQYLDTLNALAISENYTDIVNTNHMMKADYFEQIGNLDSALIYTKKEIESRLVLLSEFQAAEMYLEDKRFANNKLQAQLEKQKTELEKKKQLENERSTLVVFLIISLILLAATLYLYQISRTKTRQLNNQHTLLIEKNADIKATLQKNEALVQEIYHRVKNNLQFINSIVAMQMGATVNKDQITALRDLNMRIQAISIVHEQLYQKGSYETLNLRGYLSDIVENFRAFRYNAKVNFVLHLESIEIVESKATSVGMILTELITNSLKYAFANVDEPKIEIRVSKSQKSKRIDLKYVDNGCGLKDNYQEGMGLRLINSFTQHLEGRSSFSQNGSLTFTLQFTS